jgi:hypothetical protein
MATTNCRNCPDTYTVMSARTSPAAPALPAPSAVCPTCGGLECLCRPRFFDGQLLSADDLTRLERYIIGKNRLHNRYLHGWGVVCGLEVVCDPCKDQVIVRKGYALSPCGDDIVVCNDVTVPICDLITKCKRESGNDCFSNQLTDAERGCKDAEEPWVLSICYDEKPSRGITPLRGGSGQACCSRCACGGSSACGCSCHESTSSASGSSSARYAPAQCEPSVACEGYRFTVTKGSASVRESRKLFQGEMVDRFNACIKELFAVFPENPQDPTNPTQLYQYCCAFHEALVDFFSGHSSYDCQLDEKLAAIVCPKQNGMSDADYQSALGSAYLRNVNITLEYIQYCLCSIFLPPCPEAADENCVPLATVKIQRNGCHVLGVCNFSARRFATTFPALSYWLSWAPIGETLRNFLVKICCTPLQLPGMEAAPNPAGVAGVQYNQYQPNNQSKMAYENLNTESAGMKGNGVSQAAKDSTQVFAQAWASRSVEFDPRTIILDAMGMGDAKGLPFLSAEERRNPLATLLANQIAVPMVETFLPKNPGDISNLARSAEVAASGAETKKTSGVAPQAAAAASDFAQLKAQMDALQRTVAEQQRTIDSLSNRPAKKA